MQSRLQDNENCKVIIVDPAGTARQMMTEVMRNALGFTNVQGMSSNEEVLRYLEVEPAHWLILPLMADQPVNAMHILKLCTEVPELRQTRVSLLLDETEQFVVPMAFEMGMLSYHAKPYTKDSLTEDLKRLVSALAAVDYNETLASASLIRQWISQSKNFAARLNLEKSLLETFPGDAQILMGLAEAMFLTGQRDRAKNVLAQVKLVNPKLSDKVDEIANTLFGAGTKIATVSENSEEALNLLGIQSCVVVDSDDTIATAVEETLGKLGVTKVTRFADGISAAEALEQASEPELVIMEWRIPKLTGPMLVQRIRSANFLNVPIIVLSSLIKADDMPLLKEMGVSAVINKPLNKELFIPDLIWAMQQERAPSDLTAVERKMRRLLDGGKLAEAEPLRAQLQDEPNYHLSKKKLIAAEFAFAAGKFIQARDLCVEALKLSGDTNLLFNLLGKIFMRLADYKSALKCLAKAQEISPQNIERLCSIAEAQTEVGDTKAADGTINAAKALDPDNSAIAETEVKVAIAKGDTEGAKKIMGSLESLSNLISQMNNKAVAQARNGMTKEAAELYQKTVDSIPDDRPEVRGVVLYNLALALVRQGNLESARSAAKEAAGLKDANERILKKAASLDKRLTQAIDKGVEFKIHESAKAEAAEDADPVEDDRMLILAKVEVRRGDICCYKIFNNPNQSDTPAQSLLAKPPRFASRAAIEREEAMGDGRLQKQAS